MTRNPEGGPGGRIARGEIYLCDLSRVGGRLWKQRPALVVQNDRGNLFSDETVVVAIRSGRSHRRIPVLVQVRAGQGGLDRDSLVDAGQILTLHQSLLGRLLGRFPSEVMMEVDQALRTSLAI